MLLNLTAAPSATNMPESGTQPSLQLAPAMPAKSKTTKMPCKIHEKVRKILTVHVLNTNTTAARTAQAQWVSGYIPRYAKNETAHAKNETAACFLLILAR